MTDPKPGLPVRPISDLVADPEFPSSAIGALVDIKGYIGVVAGVVNNSIKVRSAEGNMVSYNFHALRRLYGRPNLPDATPPTTEIEAKGPVLLEPEFNVPLNFSAPLVSIEAVASKSDFPACALGMFVDLHGFAGIVVAVVGRSLKVRSCEGATRSYNADGLRKIYAQGPQAIDAPSLGAPAPSV